MPSLDEATYNNATSRELWRIPSPAGAGELQVAGLKKLREMTRNVLLHKFQCV